jgi:hypothetical protein
MDIAIAAAFIVLSLIVTIWRSGISPKKKYQRFWFGVLWLSISGLATWQVVRNYRSGKELSSRLQQVIVQGEKLSRLEAPN